MGHARIGAWALSALLLWVAGTATAQESEGDGLDVEARALYEAGLAAYNAGRYESALASFSRGHEASGRAAFLYNIGLTQERLFNLEEALAAYRGYLEGVPDAPNRALVERRIERIAERLAQGGISGGQEEAPPPEDDEADPEGALGASTSDAARPDEEEGEVVSRQRAPEPVDEPPPSGGDDGALLGAGLGVLGGGAALVVVGAILGGAAIAEHGSLESGCSPTCTPDETAGGRSLALAADIFLIGGAVVAATGLILTIVGLTSGSDDSETAIRVSPIVSPQLAGLTVEGAF